MGEAYIIFQACLNESDIIYAVETMTRNLIKRDSRWTGNKAGRGLASLFMSLLFNPISGACRCFVFCLLSQVLLLTAPSGSSSMGASEIAATFRRGVPVVKRSLYNPNLETFACLDGSKKIPIQQVNDDYCDCRDGSDEPGTSACPQGSFYCVNMGYKPLVIPSSRVNDGICDCCDASDEWRGIGTCTNICNELGKVLRDELEKQMELRRQGWTKRLEYSAEGRSANEARVLKLEKLKASRESLKKERDDAENSKAEIEAREKEVKDSYEAAWDAMKTARRAELSQAAGEAAFKALDTSEDGMLVPTELLDRHDLDTDGNGELSPEEAKSLVGESGVDLIAFLQTVWPTVESKYRAPVNLNIPSIKGQGQPDTTDQHQEIAESDVSLRNPSMEEDSLDPPVVEADETVPTPSVQTLDSEEEHPDDIDPFIPEEPTEDFGDDDDSNNEDNERGTVPPDVHEAKPPTFEAKDEDNLGLTKPEYDEDTKIKIEAADTARRIFDEVDSRFRDWNERFMIWRRLLLWTLVELLNSPLCMESALNLLTGSTHINSVLMIVFLNEIKMEVERLVWAHLLVGRMTAESL